MIEGLWVSGLSPVALLSLEVPKTLHFTVHVSLQPRMLNPKASTKGGGF